MPDKPPWLLLIHQLPPKPAYFRVKIWRRLQRLGAVAIKNAVYALPHGDQAMEDLHWIQQEILEGGGEASICEAHFVEGLGDAEIEELFRTARNVDYGELLEEARALRDRTGQADSQDLPRQLGRLRRRLAEVAAIDFFDAPLGKEVDSVVAMLEARLNDRAIETMVQPVRGRIWVTRRGVMVDRIASVWLIRRFIDPDASFKFVTPRGYRPAPGELRFDMFEAEFGHEGDRCTFETLVARFGLKDPALAELAEIVHDVDLKDQKFARAEAPGLDRLILGLAAAHRDDDSRLARGSLVLDDLYVAFQHAPPSQKG